MKLSRLPPYLSAPGNRGEAGRLDLLGGSVDGPQGVTRSLVPSRNSDTAASVREAADSPAPWRAVSGAERGSGPALSLRAARPGAVTAKLPAAQKDSPSGRCAGDASAPGGRVSPARGGWFLFPLAEPSRAARVSDSYFL